MWRDRRAETAGALTEQARESAGDLGAQAQQAEQASARRDGSSARWSRTRWWSRWRQWRSAR